WWPALVVRGSRRARTSNHEGVSPKPKGKTTISYLLAGPAEEPVSLAETRAFLKVDDTAEDALITTLMGAARMHVEGVTGRALLAQSWRVVLDAWPDNGQVRLTVTPFMAVTGIAAYDATGVG